MLFHKHAKEQNKDLDLKKMSEQGIISKAKDQMTGAILCGALGLTLTLASFNLMISTTQFNGKTQYLPNFFGFLIIVGLIMIFVYTQQSKRFRKTELFRIYREKHVDWGFLITDVLIAVLLGAQVAYAIL